MPPLHERRTCKCSEHRGDEKWHGKTTGYYVHRCGCAQCVERMRAYSRGRYQTNGIAHRQGMSDYRARNHDQVLDQKAGYRRANRAAIQVREGVYTSAVGELDSLAERKHQRWTAEEDATVLRTDLRVIDIAAELGRTFRAVKARRSMLRKRAR